MEVIDIELEKIKVIIEGSANSFINESKKAKAEASSLSTSVKKDLSDISKTSIGDGTLQQIRNMNDAIKKTISDTKNAVIPKSIGEGITEYVKNAQLAAGIRVYSDDYLMLENDIVNAEKSLDKLYMKQKTMSDADIYEETDDYKELAKSIAATEKRLNGLMARQDKMRSTGTGHNSSSWKSIQYDIEETRKTLEAYKIDVENMKADGTTTQHTQEWNNITSSIGQAERALNEYRSELGNMKSAGMDTQTASYGKLSGGSHIQSAAASIAYIPQKLQEIKAKINETIKRIPFIGRVATETAYVASKAFSGLKTVLSKITPIIRKVSGAFGALIQKFATGIPAFSKLGKSVNSSSQGFSHGLKSMMKYGLGIRSLFVLANKIRNAITDGFKNLAQYSNQTNTSISMLMSSLTQIKNALATAFAPILNVIAPLLNVLIQKVIHAVSAIGMLFSSLTGQKTFTKAKKVNQDFAASLNQNAKNASKANKENQKLQRTLLGFDQINKLDDHSDPGSGNTNNVGDIGGLSPSDMFEEVLINSKIKEFADKLKESWRNADFTEIGQIVGNKLNASLEGIPWGKIQNTLNRIAKSVATFLNGFIETADWGLVGNTISTGINTAFMTGDTFARNFHWNSLGKAIGDGINGAMYGLNWELIKGTIHDVVFGIIDSINAFLWTAEWDKVGATIAEFLNAKLEAAYTAVTEFDWAKLGDSIAEAINGLFSIYDWEKLGQGISNLAKGILDSLIHAVENTNWEQVGEKVKTVIANIDWTGIANRLFELLGAALGGLAAFIGGLIGDSVLAAKEFFEEKIEECGGNVVLGILKGIRDALVNIGQWIYDNIFTPIVKGFKSAFGIHSPSTVMEEQGGYIIEGLLGGLKGNIESVITWFKNLPGNIKKTLGNAKEWLVEKGKGAIEGIKNGYESVKESALFSKFKKLKDEAFSSVGDIAGMVKQKGTDVISGIKEGYDRSKQNGLLSEVEKLRENVFSSIGNVSKHVMKKGSDISSGIKLGYEDSKGTIKNAVSGIPNLIANGIGSLWNIGKNAIKSFADGFSSIHIPMPHIGWDWNRFSLGNFDFSVPSFKLNWYINGGFPAAGEMFVARESGPELVGRMGKRSAVANNGQIVDGIKAGVYDAVVEAMMLFQGNRNADGREPVIDLTIMADCETVYKIVKKGEKKSELRYEAVVTV